jgi:fructose-1,6-bisphosphatase II
MKCVGGEIQCKLWPRNDDERALAQAKRIDLTKVYTTNDLVQGENVFFAATGITDGEFLQGVRYYSGGARTHSVVMRLASGTVRYIESRHHWNKLMRISGVQYARKANGENGK